MQTSGRFSGGTHFGERLGVLSMLLVFVLKLSWVLPGIAWATLMRREL
jgi:hypothetical protein